MSRKKKKKKSKQTWRKTKHRLHDKHTWDAPKGYKVMVLDRGAVSFNIPESWVLAKMEPNLEIHDGEPPNDNARLSVTFWRFPPGIDWGGLPLEPLLLDSVAGIQDKEDYQLLEQYSPQQYPRKDIEIYWLEHRFIDPEEHREAYTRVTIARGWDVTIILTFDYWLDDAEKLRPEWEEVMRSLQLGRNIQDPLRGETLH